MRPPSNHPESDPPGGPLSELTTRLAALPRERLLPALRGDQERRWLGGRGVPAEDYLAAFPAVASSAEDAVILIMGEVALRQTAGETPAIGEYAARFPTLAGALALQFEIDQLVGTVGPSEGGLDLNPSTP